jgi:hypothetical protein
MSEDSNTKPSRETRRKDVKEMGIDELRSEVYRLRRIRALQQHTIDAKQHIIEYMQGVEARRITDAIEKMLTGWRYRG